MTFLLQTCSKNQCFPSCKNQLPFHCFLHWFFNICRFIFALNLNFFLTLIPTSILDCICTQFGPPNGSPNPHFFSNFALVELPRTSKGHPKDVQRSWNIDIFLQTAVLGALLAHAGDLVASFWFNFSRFGFHVTFCSINFGCNPFNLKGLGRGWGKEQCLT